jgi:hypothetical protein
MFPQGVALVIQSKDTALLKDCNDLVSEQRELAIDDWRHDIEAIGCAGLEPLLFCITADLI